MRKYLVACFIIIAFLSFSPDRSGNEGKTSPFVVLLGVAQDGGYPQAGCNKDCCKRTWINPKLKRFVSCLALVDPETKERWLFDCTPDFPSQLHLLDSIVPGGTMLSGIFLTHAHIGHYTGLMHLGREVMSTKEVKVWAMPRMKAFIENNGPWSQLVKLDNIRLQPLKADSTVNINPAISVTPLQVPHRDEYSETVGFRVVTRNRSFVFIPDIDKWNKWKTDILEIIKQNDFVFIDGTFYKEGEISGRSMAEVPHPFISESMELFKSFLEKEKKKIYFIHFNHTNPALIEGSEAQKEIEKNGFHIARQGQRVEL